MRSRYTAYVMGDVDHIARTTAPESRAGFDVRSARAWSKESTWLGLRIVATERGGPGDDAGVVEFVATYRRGGATLAHRERSRFRRIESGEWTYVDGDAGAARTDESPTLVAPAFAAATQKAGRNDPCPCGSDRKWKQCGLPNTEEHQRNMAHGGKKHEVTGG